MVIEKEDYKNKYHHVRAAGAAQAVGSSSEAMVNYRSNYPSSVDTGIVRIYSPQLPF